jgi:hypothetical protein
MRDAVNNVIAAFQGLANISLGPFQGESPPPVAEWFWLAGDAMDELPDTIDSMQSAFAGLQMPSFQVGEVNLTESLKLPAQPSYQSASPTVVGMGGGSQTSIGGDTINVAVTDTLSAALVGALVADHRRARLDSFAGA